MLPIPENWQASSNLFVVLARCDVSAEALAEPVAPEVSELALLKHVLKESDYACHGRHNTFAQYYSRPRCNSREFVIASTIAAVTTAAFLLAHRAPAVSDELPAPNSSSRNDRAGLPGRSPSANFLAPRNHPVDCNHGPSRTRDRLLLPRRTHPRLAPLARRHARSRFPACTAPRLRGRVSPRLDSRLGETRLRSTSLNDEPPAENILQHLTRIRLEDGTEAIRGGTHRRIRRRRTSDHFIRWRPPFERLPQIEANIADDSDATVKVAQFLHNSGQLEVRLPDPAEDPFRVTVELYAEELAIWSSPCDQCVAGFARIRQLGGHAVI